MVVSHCGVSFSNWWPGCLEQQDEPLERKPLCSIYIQLWLFITCRLLVRSSDHYLHVVVPSAPLCGNSTDSVEEVVKAVAKEMCIEDFKPAQLTDLEKELLRIDEVHTSELIADFSHSEENASSVYWRSFNAIRGENLGSPHQSMEACKLEHWNLPQMSPPLPGCLASFR